MWETSRPPASRILATYCFEANTPAVTFASTGLRPTGLSTWGDGRLVIVGTEGMIELRKYVDLAGRTGTDHVFVVDRSGTRHIDARHEPLVYFERFVADVRQRTESAMRQDHVFTVCRLALQAQAQAEKLPAKKPIHLSEQS